MENLTKKSDFRSAYAAGRHEIERRKRPFSLVRALVSSAVLIFALEVNKSLAARFSLSWFERTALDFLAGVIVVSVLLIVVWRVPLKRNHSSKD